MRNKDLIQTTVEARDLRKFWFHTREWNGMLHTVWRFSAWMCINFCNYNCLISWFQKSICKYKHSWKCVELSPDICRNFKKLMEQQVKKESWQRYQYHNNTLLYVVTISYELWKHGKNIEQYLLKIQVCWETMSCELTNGLFL